MIVENSVTAKIDRPTGIIDFTVVKSTNDILNDWSSGLNKLMELVNNTTHLISKEQMIQQHLTANKK